MSVCVLTRMEIINRVGKQRCLTGHELNDHATWITNTFSRTAAHPDTDYNINKKEIRKKNNFLQ